jgi:hypothetical protein
MSEKVGPYRVVDVTPARHVTTKMLDLSGPTRQTGGAHFFSSADEAL